MKPSQRSTCGLKFWLLGSIVESYRQSRASKGQVEWNSIGSKARKPDGGRLN
jgi:hypothetical protein